MQTIPPIIACIFATIGMVAFSRVLTREWQRANAELDASQRAAAAVWTKDLPTLRLDPTTGEYRPQ